MINRTHLLGFGGGGGGGEEGGGGEGRASTISASRLTSVLTFFFRSLALVLGTFTALGFFVFGDCVFFDVLKFIL